MELREGACVGGGGGEAMGGGGYSVISNAKSCPKNV